MPKGVYPRKPRVSHPDILRRLRPGEAIPDGIPVRLRTSDGYIVLRWKVGIRSHVECLEHRVVAGNPEGEHVHHRNRQRDDNRPENLEPIDPVVHGHLHKPISFDLQEAARLYALGYGTPEIGRRLGVDGSNVYRGLRAAGVTMRPVGTLTARHRARLRETTAALWKRRSPAERDDVIRRAVAVKTANRLTESELRLLDGNR